MTDLAKPAGSQEHGSRIRNGEFMAKAAVVFLLVALQGMFIATHSVMLNAAAEPAPFGIVAP